MVFRTVIILNMAARAAGFVFSASWAFKRRERVWFRKFFGNI